MKKKIITFTLASASLSFAFTDSDLDGVDDAVDKCPNTPFTQIVGPDGCPVGRIGQERKSGKRGTFYFKLGGGFSSENSKTTTTSSVSLAYAYQNWYLSFSSTYFIHDDNVGKGGMGDSFLYGSYSKFIKNVYATVGLSTKIPTGSNDFSDKKVDITPSVSLDYIRGKDDYFVYYGYTFKGDSSLKDVQTASVGAGYQFTKKFYGSLSLDWATSAIDRKSKYTSSLFALYNFTKRYYTTLSYSYGLNSRATDHSALLKLGVRF